MSVRIDPIELQVTTGALRAACEEMGAVLIRSAHSANIKERRDASTALFDAAGEMVMQAEHIPVHLGAMPAAVAAVRDRGQAPGRSWILNDPFAGGTHLPDITVITPVYETGSGGALLGFAASRAHHADVGGAVPGSMPADSHTLAEEGVVISPRVLDEPAIAEITAAMRQPAERRADLRAQLAANRVGAQRLSELAGRLGVARLREVVAEVLDYAERRTRACLQALPDGEHHAADVLEGVDGDLPLRLAARVHGDELTLDFSGSAPQHGGNLNCPLAVTLSACYFAVRVLTDPDIPPSSGAYRPLQVLAPPGSLLNALPGGGGRCRQRRDVLARGRSRARGVRTRPRPGHDEQPDARQRLLLLLRDARRRAGRLPGRRRARVRCTWRCRTRSTHRSRRSSATSRCGCAPTRSAADRAGTAGTVAARASSATSRRSRRCSTR